MDEKMRALLMLLERSGGLNLKNEPSQETLAYLSQLEDVARRLKDELMTENLPEVHH